jgi:uncharacterized protein (DUF2249 family)
MSPSSLHPALAHIPAAELLDARDIPCSRKHPLILERAHALAVGAGFVLVNGHAPEPLRYQFEALFPACFHWDYLLVQDDLAAVRITRVRETPPECLTRLAAQAPLSCGHSHAA